MSPLKISRAGPVILILSLAGIVTSGFIGSNVAETTTLHAVPLEEELAEDDAKRETTCRKVGQEQENPAIFPK